MFSRRKGDFNARKFWAWFNAEAQGLANGLEALARGESEAAWQFAGLAERIRKFDVTMEADVVRTLDGGCELRLSGGLDGAAQILLASAPHRQGWRFAAPSVQTDARRVPFRLAPRPSLDAVSFDGLPIDAVSHYGRREAYA